MLLVDAQLFVAGLYRPPVFKFPRRRRHPQMIISLPVHTAVW